MAAVKNMKLSGYLFIGAGLAFFAAALIGKQVALFAIGAMFIAIAASFLHKARTP